MIDAAFADLAALTSTKRACGLLGKSRATHYRRLRPPVTRPSAPRPAPPNKLTAQERAAVLATLNHESFMDKLPAQVWATLLDEGTYLCSESTMYRILRAVGPVQAGLGVLSARDRVLLAQDQNFQVLGCGGPSEQGKPAGDPAEHEVDQAERHE